MTRIGAGFITASILTIALGASAAPGDECRGVDRTGEFIGQVLAACGQGASCEDAAREAVEEIGQLPPEATPRQRQDAANAIAAFLDSEAGGKLSPNDAEHAQRRIAQIAEDLGGAMFRPESTSGELQEAASSLARFLDSPAGARLNPSQRDDAVRAIRSANRRMAEPIHQQDATPADLQAAADSLAAFLDSPAGAKLSRDQRDDAQRDIRHASQRLAEPIHRQEATAADLQAAATSLANYLDSPAGAKLSRDHRDDVQRDIRHASQRMAEPIHEPEATAADLQAAATSLANYLDSPAGAKLSRDQRDDVQRDIRHASQRMAEPIHQPDATAAELQAAATNLANYLDSPAGAKISENQRDDVLRDLRHAGERMSEPLHRQDSTPADLQAAANRLAAYLDSPAGAKLVGHHREQVQREIGHAATRIREGMSEQASAADRLRAARNLGNFLASPAAGQLTPNERQRLRDEIQRTRQELGRASLPSDAPSGKP